MFLIAAAAMPGAHATPALAQSSAQTYEQPSAQSTAQPPSNRGPASTGAPSWGLVFDGRFTSRDSALGPEKGFGLGHTELIVGGNVDPDFAARATAALHEHDGKIEVELEEAWLETLSLPAGLQLRAGRMLSQIGYLNQQHPHADDFVDRPALYRALLGTHYSDTGLRLNWTAPTDLYWRSGIEILNGKRYVGSAEQDPAIGVITAGTHVGGDLGLSHSWQAGASVLWNRRTRKVAPHVEAPVGAADVVENVGAHDHAHAMVFTGRRLFLLDGVWKWAPGGNNRARQLRLSAEYARVLDADGLDSDARAMPGNSGRTHQAWYVSAVYRFAPEWEAGLRHGALQVSVPHDDHFHRGRLKESTVMLAWRPSHFSTVRAQFTKQHAAREFANASNVFMLQYVASLGAHGAHSY